MGFTLWSHQRWLAGILLGHGKCLKRKQNHSNKNSLDPFGRVSPARQSIHIMRPPVSPCMAAWKKKHENWVAPMAVERSIEKMDDLVEKMAVGKWGTPKLHDMVYHILSPLNKNQQN